MQEIGKKVWAIPEGYIPGKSVSEEPALVSHETACLLNVTHQDAEVSITVFFRDREPVGPYRVRVPARRTVHLRFTDRTNPAPIPRDTDYAPWFDGNVPIILQYKRLDSRYPNIALLSPIAYPVG